MGLLKNEVQQRARNGIRRIVSVPWRNTSRVCLVSDSSFWVISWEIRALSDIADKLGIKQLPSRLASWLWGQGLFFGSHFDLFLNEHWFGSGNRLGAAYFHGKPGTGCQEFDACFECLRKQHEHVTCLQASYRQMRDVILESGIASGKVHLIPIGVCADYFSQQTVFSQEKARERFGVPRDAFVVGSFQKDGDGWGEGLSPKHVKGPDVFVKAMGILKEEVPSLFVLLGGPARGYVKQGLEELGVPYAHHFLESYPEVGSLFQALDTYVVASREEGGPKAVLESMASGVPLVSTRVGQAQDLVQPGVNGWLVDVEDAEALAAQCVEIHKKPDALNSVIEAGLRTAAENTYEAQLPLWQKLLGSLVDMA